MPVFRSSKRIENSHGDGVWSLAWCRDGKLISGSLDGIVKLCDVDRDEILFSTARSQFGVTSVVAFGDGTKAAACFQDSKIRFFDLVNKKELDDEVLSLSVGQAYSLSLSQTDDVFVSGGHKGDIGFWSMVDKDHQQIQTMKAGEHFIYSTKFNAQSLLSCGALDGATYLVDSFQQQIVHKFNDHSMPVRGLSFSSDGNILFTASDDRQVHLHDIRTRQKIFSFSHKTAAFSVDVSSDTRTCVVGCQDGSVAVWDLGLMAQCQPKLSSHSSSVWCVAFDTEDSQRRFASAGDDSGLQLYEAI